MRTSLILVVAVTTLLAIGSCTSDLQLTPPTVGTDQRFLRSTKAAETEENGAGDEERGIKITDPAILENVAKFDDWVGQGKTAEKIYQELGLKFSWKIAYQTSRWKQFLFDEPEYLLFRKYVKYLKLIGREDP